MGEVTGISWTDHTFNPWIGCAKVHAGCTNCYAEADFDKRRHVAEWGVNGTRVVTSDAYWKKPLKWNRDAQRDGVRRKVFCASLADVFEDRPELESWREGLFDLIDSTPNLNWQLLTKRPENIRRMLTPIKTHGTGPYIRRWPNVWLGTSISNQETADKAIYELLQCRDLSPVLFLSAEPLLGAIDLCHVQYDNFVEFNALTGDHGLNRPHQGRSDKKVDWVIVGGESGPNARANNLAWTRQIISQCQDADVPCFHKQIGSFPVETIANEAGAFVDRQVYVDDRRHGGNPDEWERALRVRQFPTVG